MMETEEKVPTADFTKEARRLVESLLIAEPEHYLANYGKSLLLFNEGKVSDASEWLSKALDGAPEGCEVDMVAMKEKFESFIPKAADKERRESPTPPKKPTIIEISTERPLLVQHRTPTSDKKQFVCEICDKNFSKLFSLNRHMRLHSGERPFRCRQCDRGFSQSTDLERHYVVHSTDLNFECTECQRRFKTKKNLNSHLVTHSEARPFQCTYCDKSFKLKKMLTFHMNLHTRENTYDCPKCDKTFPAKSYLKNHMKKQHVDKQIVEQGAGAVMFLAGGEN